MKAFFGKLRNKIFWKIILIFWLTTLCIIVSNVLITTEIVLNQNKVEQLKETMSRLTTEAAMRYEQGGPTSLKRWYKSTLKRHGLKVVLLDEQKRPLAPPFRRHKDHLGNDHNDKDHPRFFVERRYFEKLLKLMHQRYYSASGNSYTLELLPSRRLVSEFRPPALLHVYRIGSSFLFILLGSWWLARSVSRPVQVLKKASDQVAEGQLHVRVSPEIGNRKDELGELATTFDHMASRIEELLASQRRLFSDISHDIRTPLTRQKLAIELARETDNPGPMLDKLEKQNQIIEELLDRLLTLFKLDEHPTKRKPSRIKLSNILESALHNAELELRAKRLSVESHISETATILAERDSLLRVFDNLISNAVKYSPDGTYIFIEAVETPEGVRIVMRDNGPGIPEQELAQVFTPFYRADQSRNSKTGGYGLGLAITKKILDQHSASISLANASEGGLEVIILFPACTD